MMGSSSQNTLLASNGAFGGKYNSGDTITSGNIFAIQALSDDITIGASTLGNINNLIGAVIPAGSVIFGQFTAVEVNAPSILYFN